MGLIIMNNKDIGSRIKQRRLELSLTLQDIATEIGVARSTIQRYENGTIENLKLPVIEAIARVLEVEPSWILGKSPIKEKLPTNPLGPDEQLDDISFALYGKVKNLSDAQKRDVLRFVEFIEAKDE